MNQRLKNILVVVGLGFVFAIYEFYDFWSTDFPVLQLQENQRAQQIAGLTAESQKLQNFAKNIEIIKTEFRELNQQLEAVLEHMPKTFNLASLLRKLTMLAQNSGIEILVFKPKREVARVEPQRLEPPKPGEIKPPEVQPFYETISVDFSLKGPFTQTLVFFDQLARLKRIVNVDSLKITTHQDRTLPRGASVVASTDVVIRTYRFTE